MKETRPGTGSSTADLQSGASTGSIGKSSLVDGIRPAPKPGDDADKSGGGADKSGDGADKGGGATDASAATPAAAGPLAADELVLTRDPQYAKAGFLDWFRGQVKGKLESWTLVFDAARVRMADASGTAVVALRWDPAWGDQPVTRDVPFSMAPVDAKAAVAGARKLKGWSKVAAGDQTILSNLLGGETNQLSATAREHLRGQFSGLAGQPDTDQAKALTGVIGAKDAAPGVVDEQVTTGTTGFDLEGPTEHKDYDFRGKKADAEVWKAKFKDAVTVDIVAPKAPETGFHYHTVQQTADAASYLPKSARSVINTILLNVQVNPDDAYWAVQYNQADFHSYMTAGAAGVVTIYPDKNALPNDNYMRGTMIHETGHTWSYKTWGTDTTKGKWVDWKSAMDKDKVSVSGYAMASISEDVAETIQIYVSTQGTAKNDEYKQMVPNRFAILDKEYK